MALWLNDRAPDFPLGKLNLIEADLHARDPCWGFVCVLNQYLIALQLIQEHRELRSRIFSANLDCLIVTVGVSFAWWQFCLKNCPQLLKRFGNLTMKYNVLFTLACNNTLSALPRHTGSLSPIWVKETLQQPMVIPQWLKIKLVKL